MARRRSRQRGIGPSAGVTAKYREKLKCLLDAMQASIEYWLGAALKANEPEVKALMARDEVMRQDILARRGRGALEHYDRTKPPVTIAMDATPADELQRAIRRLARRWQKKFNAMAPELADYFAQEASKRSDKQLQDILRRGGVTVRFRTTKAQRDILNATVNANVSLIKSIPQQYLGKVEGIVMRSVQAGRDLSIVYQDLRKEFGVTKRRASLIARDQNNKATSALSHARQVELGLTEGIWRHSHAGKKKRPTHVAMDGKKYDLRKGMFDPDPKVNRHVFPGELIECRCQGIPIIPGFEP